MSAASLLGKERDYLMDSKRTKLSMNLELHAAGGPLPVLGHDDFGDVAWVLLPRMELFPLLLGRVDVLSVDEHHHVGVLLDAAAVPEVGKPGAVARPFSTIRFN